MLLFWRDNSTISAWIVLKVLVSGPGRIEERLAWLVHQRVQALQGIGDLCIKAFHDRLHLIHADRCALGYVRCLQRVKIECTYDGLGGESGDFHGVGG